jgi:predicted Zn-dependent peptidase
MLVVEADVSLGSEGLALKQVSAILEDLAEHGPTEQELRAAVGYTLGTHELGFGTQHGRASCLLSYLTTGLDLPALAALPEVLGQVTRSDVAEVSRLFHPVHFAGVLSGPIGDEPRQGEFRYE